MSRLAPLPDPPYYAVIFTSQRTSGGDNEYGAMAERMVELAARQPGFLGIESVHDKDGVGITVSYWSSLDSIDAWREQAEHRVAQARGKREWYEQFALRVCRVERAYGFTATAGAQHKSG